MQWYLPGFVGTQIWEVDLFNGISTKLLSPSPPPPSPQVTAGCGLQILAIFNWKPKARFCGAPHSIWTRALISQPPSISFTFTTSSVKHTAIHGRFNTHWTHLPAAPLWGVWEFKYSLLTLRRPGYRGHCGPAPLGMHSILPLWLQRM